MSGPTYQPPLSPQIAQWLAELDDDANEFFQERAAVREHMGGFSRAEAENVLVEILLRTVDTETVFDCSTFRTKSTFSLYGTRST